MFCTIWNPDWCVGFDWWKVRLLVGLRERFSQVPIVGMKMHCTVEEYPR